MTIGLPQVRIVALDDYERVALKYLPVEELSAVCRPEIAAFPDHAASPETLVERITGANVVIAMRERSTLSADVLDHLAPGTLIVTTGRRNAAIDVAAARDSGITVCATGGNDDGPAELTWALILAVARRIPQADQFVRDGGWGVTPGTVLQQKTLGIIGYGQIGSAIAGYGRAFGMRILVASETTPASELTELGIEPASVAEVLMGADVVTVHKRYVPGSPALITYRQLCSMKPTSILINTARAGLIDEPGLVQALNERRIAGAGLDVFGQEPLPADSPLLTAPNTVLTPHIGYVTDDRLREYFKLAATEIRAFLRGDPTNILSD